MAKFDWWQGTVHGQGREADGVIAALVRRFGDCDVAPDRPRNGYVRGAKIIRGERVFSRIWWAGNPGIHVIGTGVNAPEVGAELKALGALPSRVDACEDWIVEGVAEMLFSKAQEFATDQRIMLNHQGDWTRNEGRTLYLGSRSSTAQLVIYEKGFQVGGPPEWVRMEVRLYPKRNRDLVGRLSPGECFFACPWVGRFLHERLGWELLPNLSIGTVRERSDSEKARLALIRQYGKIIQSWCDEVGSWEELGKVIGSQIGSESKSETATSEAVD